ncbi:MAG TPA: hypothetical protein VJC07_04165 [Candidatus Nanoarchaeia archaeon]|nr:hypothetical protein [Candidatus Nanoarchaeia archaeon]
MKPIEDQDGNKLYGFSFNDMKILIRWQKMQVIMLGIVIGIAFALLFWIAKNNIVTRIIYGG